MTLNANALTTVAVAKDHLGIPSSDTTQDSRIEMFINVVSDRISNYCERQLVAANIIDVCHGGMSNMLMLQEWPINSVTEIAIDNTGVFGSGTVIDAATYRVIDEGTLLYNSTFPYGYGNIRIKYNAGYATIPGDIQMACLLFVEWLYRFRSTQNIGRTGFSKGGESVTILQDMPPIIKSLLEPYRRTEFSVPNRPARNV
jgi:hypothetical protein